ncbi:ABC transporter permease [Paenibacillus sp. GCM10023248]|uniref:ABC transporter permease n=1 Tax=Bacillales TaxID=1385 RepID=UPI002378D0D5|nr:MULTISPECIES: ABC transporter permease [Bacillales]MDD9271685.1 ABC transporter permease [Paenibacillus sp. MAHUQ-63]MDR6883952.1 putative ABC-type exoprotein transport system permease subunit [Bacillus sp. 3255]
MTNSFQIFARRVRSDWLYQYKALRTAVDWIIAIYFVIPLLIVAGYQYYSWWMSPPSWFSMIPLFTVGTVCYLFTWLGTIRYYVEEGDQLFLRQNEGWFQHLMLLGYRYSLVLQGVTTLLLMLLFLPLLVKTYAFGVSQAVSLWLLTYLLKINLGLLRQLLALRFRGVVLWLLRIAAFAALFFLYQTLVAAISHNTSYIWAVLLALLALIVYLGRVRLREKGTFFADIARERDARMRIVSLMLIRVVERNRRPKRKRPLLFKSSQRLFKGKGASNGIADLLAKSFFRNGTQWKQSLQFAALISGVMFILPGFLKITVWILAACLLSFWRKSFCKDELTAPFLSLFSIEDTEKHRALQLATPILVLPALILISLFLGISMFTWWGPIIMIGAAIPLAYGTSSVFTSWY